MKRNILAIGALAIAMLCGLPAEANQSNTWSPTTGTVSGLQLTTNYNNAFTAIQTCNSGASAPTNDQSLAAVKGQCWLNTTSGALGISEQYDGSNWTTIGWLDSTNHQWIANNAGGAGTIASNTTTDLGTVVNPVMSISGTTTITSFGTTALQGAIKYVNFTGILTLTHNGTSLILPNGGSNIVTAVGDTAVVEALGSGNWRMLAYQAASGSALSANSNLTSSIAFTGVITATTVTANVNNWAPTGLASASTIRFNVTGGNWSVTGLTGGTTGRVLVLHNISTSNSVFFTTNDGGSTAANRFCFDVVQTVAANQSMTVIYDGTLSCWKSLSTRVAAPVGALFRNLKIVNDSGAPTTTMDISWDELVVSDLVANGLNTTIKLSAAAFGNSVAPVMTASGANGLDTGSIVNNTITWYYVYVISTSQGSIAGLYSLATTCSTVTLPANYTMCARVGAVRTDGAATARWMRSIQYGRSASWVAVASSNTVTPPNIANGTAGTYSVTSPTLASVSLTNFVPTTASAIRIAISSAYNGGTGASVLVAPNTSYGATNQGPTGTASAPWPVWNNASVGSYQGGAATIILEAASIAWASSAAGGAIWAMGWEDNL